MDGATALSVKLLEQFIPQLLPPHAQGPPAAVLPPGRRGARRARTASPRLLARSRARDPQRMPLLAPTIDDTVARTVYQCLLDGRRFTANYTARSAEPREFVVSPLGLVAKGPLLYLVCTLWDYTDLRQLALHRIRAAHPDRHPGHTTPRLRPRPLHPGRRVPVSRGPGDQTRSALLSRRRRAPARDAAQHRPDDHRPRRRPRARHRHRPRHRTTALVAARLRRSRRGVVAYCTARGAVAGPFTSAARRYADLVPGDEAKVQKATVEDGENHGRDEARARLLTQRRLEPLNLGRLGTR